MSKEASQETIDSGDRLVVCAARALLYSIRFSWTRITLLPQAVYSAGRGVSGGGVVAVGVG